MSRGPQPALAFLLLVLIPCAAGAADPLSSGPILPGAIQGVAASGDAVAVITRGDGAPRTVVLARGGDWSTVVSRWPDATARERSGNGAEPGDGVERRHQADVDDVLSLYEMTDADRDAPELEDLMDEEGVEETPRRRKPRGRDPLLPRGLAASQGHLWMASSRGVWRLATRPIEHQWQRAGLDDRAVDLIAAATHSDGDGGGGGGGGERTVVAASSGGSIWRSDDTGNSWRLVGAVTGRPRALAIAPGGADVLVADDEGVWALAPHRPPRAVLEGAAQELAVCGGVALAMAGGQLLALSSTSLNDEPRRIGEAPVARGIRCDARQRGPWIATGGAPLISIDAGITWTPFSDDPTTEITTAAIGAGQTWIGTPEGLFLIGATPSRGHQRRVETSETLALTLDDDSGAPWLRPPREPPWWGAYLPRVSVLGSGDMNAERQNFRAMVVFTVPLQRVRRSRAGALAAELGRRRLQAAVAAQRREALRLTETLQETIP